MVSLLKSSSRKKGYPYYKGASQEPRENKNKYERVLDCKTGAFGLGLSGFQQRASRIRVLGVVSRV